MKKLSQGRASLSFKPYWWETEDKVVLAKYVIPQSVDVLVIGAGYTGLSAGLVASEFGAKTLVVDAEEVGKGASTRNGGMLGAHPRVSWEQLSLRFGEETADQIFKEASDSLTFVRDLMSSAQISCDLIESGRLQLAWSKSDHEKQKKLVSVIEEKSNISVRIIPRNELVHEIKTERYHGGILFNDHCGINPLKFHNGLIKALKRKEVPIVENMPVFSIIRNRDRFKVHCGNQVIFASNVIMATNGYTKHNFNWFKKRVFPVPSFLIATEDLPRDLIKKLSPRGRMMVETRLKYSYFRTSPNGKKIIFGGRAAMKPIPLALAAHRLKTVMDDIWPELENFRLSNVWTGFTGYSFNHIPHVGHHNGIHYAMGYSGSGTVLASYLGAKAAYQALDDPRGETGYSSTSFITKPFHIFGTPYFLSLADFWYKNVIDRLQTR